MLLWLSHGLMRHGGRLSGPAVAVSVAAVAIGVCVVLLTLAVGRGFQNAVRDKLAGAGGNVRITAVTLADNQDAPPITLTESQLGDLASLPGVTGVAPYIARGAVVKTDSTLLALTLKGVDQRWQWPYIERHLTAGHTAQAPDQVCLSRAVCQRMALREADTLRLYFFDGQGIRARRATLAGIYDTGMEELDLAVGLCHESLLRRVQQLDTNQWSGVEVRCHAWDDMAATTERVERQVADWRTEQQLLRVRSMAEQEPQIMGWLRLLDQNVLIIIILIICVAGGNLVCGLLIICLEQSPSLAILKVLGMCDGAMRRLMLLAALRVSALGTALGTLAGCALVALQQATGLARLDPASYYVDRVPTQMDATTVAITAAAALALSAAVLWLTTAVVAKIRVARVLKLRG